MNNTHSRELLVIIGPSGSGKSTIAQRLVDAGVIQVLPSWTTRPRRKGEKNAVEHVFVGERQFRQLKEEGFFIHTVKLFGLPYEYGLPRISQRSKDGVMTVLLRARLVTALQRVYPECLVYQIEDSFERIKPRLQKRESSGEAQGSRLIDYEKELADGRKLAHRVFVNNRGKNDVVSEIAAAIKIDFGT